VLTKIQSLDNDKSAANRNIARLKILAPDNPDVRFLEAVIANSNNEEEKALSILQDIFDKKPTAPSMLAVVQQHWKMGAKEEAIRTLEAWSESNPDDIESRLTLAETYMVLTQSSEGISEYREVLNRSEDNLNALKSLAWYLRNDAPAQALEYAESAYRIAPDSAEILDIFAVVLMKNGETDRAVRMIDRALEILPEYKPFQSHRKMIIEADKQ
jgi:tetratricopeptide (TPR) repeat protein